MSSVSKNKEGLALDLFKGRIADVLPGLNWYQQSDAWLLRWLRARDLDVGKAEEMFRKNRRYRAEERINEVMDWKAPEIIDQDFPMKATGFDNDGSVIAIVPFGSWDVRKLVALGMKKDLLRYIDQIFENAMNFLEYKSSPTKIFMEFVLILDFEGFSLKQLASKETIETIAEIVRRFEGNHPETLKSGWIVNAPRIFEILFALVKPLLTARTLAKIRVFGCNTEEWRSALLENIQPDHLPSQYGGSNTSVQNYKITQGYDIFTQHESFAEEQMVFADVPPGLKHRINFYLPRGSKIRWNFRSEGYDIAFEMTYQDETQQKQAKRILHCARADAHLYTQKGALTAPEAGNYSIVFDNSFSRFRSKRIFYAVRASGSPVNITEATSLF